MHIRTATPADHTEIKELYTSVAGDGGIARTVDEITDDYIHGLLAPSLSEGIILVALNPADPKQLIAEIHAFRPEPAVFEHCLGDLTLVVHPQFQGKKIGRTLLTIFLEEVGLHHPETGRVELAVGESNQRAIALYQSLGFLVEGRREMRIRTPDGGYEAEILMAWTNPAFEF